MQTNVKCHRAMDQLKATVILCAHLIWYLKTNTHSNLHHTLHFAKLSSKSVPSKLYNSVISQPYVRVCKYCGWVSNWCSDFPLAPRTAPGRSSRSCCGLPSQYRRKVLGIHPALVFTTAGWGCPSPCQQLLPPSAPGKSAELL